MYTEIFLYPKPVIAALNGHTIAGGCMMALACDLRLMVTGKSRIGLNEVTFGSSLFPGSALMLQYCVGTRHAESTAFFGALMPAEEALAIGLVNEAIEPDQLDRRQELAAKRFEAVDPTAFASIKSLLRNETGEAMKRIEEEYRQEMVDIWYSESTEKKLREIKIR